MEHFKFGKASAEKLLTGCEAIRMLAPKALLLSPYDFSLLHVWRGEEVQNALYDSGASTKRWPDSKHNVEMKSPNLSKAGQFGTPDSEALDFGPYVNGQIPWKDIPIWCVIAGAFFAAARQTGMKIRWGGDWNTNGSTKDQLLLDFGHIEVIL